MIRLPCQTEIIDTRNNDASPARVIRLTIELGATIDQLWWDGIDPQKRDAAGDGHWSWGSIVQQYQGWPENTCVALCTNDDYCQGAMVVGVNALTVNGNGAVVIHYVASAPSNRPNFQPQPRYAGCGTALITYAASVSYSLGLGGVVVLDALREAESFYTHLGFVPTGQINDTMVNFELPEAEAVALLRQRGVIR